MARKVRSDILIGNLEKKLHVAPGTIRNPDGTDARSDKKLGTLRKQSAKSLTSKTKTESIKKTQNTTTRKQTAAKKIVEIITSDQQKAAKRVVKSHPKVSVNAIRKMSVAFRKNKA